MYNWNDIAHRGDIDCDCAVSMSDTPYTDDHEHNDSSNGMVSWSVDNLVVYHTIYKTTYSNIN